jgi:hypothetical protein
METQRPTTGKDTSMYFGGQVSQAALLSGTWRAFVLKAQHGQPTLAILNPPSTGDWIVSSKKIVNLG